LINALLTWPADQAQIYRSLDKLVEQGWITCTVEIQHARPNRKVYSVTGAGKVELSRWQCPQLADSARAVARSVIFAAQLRNEAIIVEQQLAALRKALSVKRLSYQP